MIKDVNKLRILRGGVYLGLSGWTLTPVTNVLLNMFSKSEAEGDLQDRSEGGSWPQKQRLRQCGHRSRNANSTRAGRSRERTIS